MYLSAENGAYRILLPSENTYQIELYMRSADKKLSRALKLSRNTPKAKGPDENSKLTVRATMKREDIKRHRLTSPQ
jgi:hypothetical protein